MKKAILLVIIPVLFIAQANYKIQKDVISSGGTKMTAGNYVLHGTVSQTTIGSVTGGNYKGIIGFWQPFDWVNPRPPYIVRATKSGNDIVLTWNKVSLDVNGYPEIIEYYSLYRDTIPSYVPGSGTYLGKTTGPDTVYTDVGVHNASRSYYYLVKAVDYGRNLSDRSNMGFKFNKFLNENVATTDMNWVSIPYLTYYSTADNIAQEMSPGGTSIIQLTNLRTDQFYEDYTYIEGLGWIGIDFAIDKGRGYEFVAFKDSTTVLAGAHDPAFRAPLVENPTATDMNWVSVPYNAVYASAQDISTEYSPDGNPMIQITNLRDDQFYEDWTYIEGLGWIGIDFPIVRGTAYEYVVNADTSWHPTVYQNRGGEVILADNTKYNRKENAYRAPLWPIEEVEAATPMMKTMPSEPPAVNTKRLPHMVTCVVDINHESTSDDPVSGRMDISNVTFTSYCLDHPEKALYEGSVSCGYALKNNKIGVVMQFGNLPYSWQPGEEAILIVEADGPDGHYYGTIKFKLDAQVNPQGLGSITLRSIPSLRQETTLKGTPQLTWSDFEDDAVIGYSLYKGDERLNKTILTDRSFSGDNLAGIELRPVFLGGYETGMATIALASDHDLGKTPNIFSFAPGYPNPFRSQTMMRYAVPVNSRVNMMIYDISGRLVRTLVSQQQKPGYYQVSWDGKDDQHKAVPAGVYFVNFESRQYQARHKLILVK